MSKALPWVMLTLAFLGETLIAGLLLVAVWVNTTNDLSLSLVLTAAVLLVWMLAMAGTIVFALDQDQR